MRLERGFKAAIDLSLYVTRLPPIRTTIVFNLREGRFVS